MIRALLIDLDGTLIDSEGVHFEAHKKALSEYGIVLTKDMYLARGMSTNRNVFYASLADEYNINLDCEEVGRRKQELYSKSFVDKIKLYPNVPDVLEKLSERYEMYIVSSTSLQGIKDSLSQFKIGKYFKDVFSAKDYTHGKPFPDVYLAVLEQTKLSANECIAIEDSRSGVLSAHAAGIRVIAIPNSDTVTQDFSEAYVTICSFTELPKILNDITD